MPRPGVVGALPVSVRPKSEVKTMVTLFQMPWAFSSLTTYSIDLSISYQFFHVPSAPTGVPWLSHPLPALTVNRLRQARLDS